MKHVILITGTPCVGKTTVAKQLACRLNAFYINLTDYAKQNSLIYGEDTERCTYIVNEEKMRFVLTNTINQSKESVVVDGHFAASVVPSNLSTYVFVLRRNPVELKEYMQKEGFSENKIYENLLAEILDICLVDALEVQVDKVCEVDVTGKTVEQTVNELFTAVAAGKKCFYNRGSGVVVDWLDFLEREGLLNQYIKI